MPADVKSLETFSEKLAAFSDEEQRHGYLDEHGVVVVPAIYHAARPFSDGRALVSRREASGEERFGYIDRKGNEVIAVEYRSAQPFVHGLAVVEPAQGRQHIIDTAGRVVRAAPPGAYPVQVVAKDRWIERRSDGTVDLVDRAGRRLAHAESILMLGGGAAFVWGETESALSVLDLNTGKRIGPLKVPAGVVSVTPLHPFSEGRAWVRLEFGSGDGSSNHLRLIDRSGATVAEPAGVRFIGPFQYGVASAQDRVEPLLFDIQGRVIATRHLGPRQNGSENGSTGPIHAYAGTLPGGLNDVQNRLYTDASGRVLFAVQAIRCGIQQLQDERGTPIWPLDDVPERCVLYAQRMHREPDPADVASVDAQRMAALVRPATLAHHADASTTVAPDDSTAADAMSVPMPGSPEFERALIQHRIEARVEEARERRGLEKLASFLKSAGAIAGLIAAIYALQMRKAREGARHMADGTAENRGTS
ncbi:MAG: WG repeat-containing protein [Proteobacteria bacterium]|nr:WG repeat-containing protein [Pseudomonadota bacterium]